MNDFPVFLINLDTDQERLEFMAEQLEFIGIKYERFSGIRGTALPGWLKPYFLNDDGSLASELSNGEVGCYASHLCVIDMVRQSGKPALILEDDLRLPDDLPDILSAISLLEIDFDILRLTFENRSLKIISGYLPTGHKIVKYSRVPAGLGAYVITPNGARKFINWRRTRTNPVDIDMRNVWDSGLKTYGLLPSPIAQNVLESSIEKMNSVECNRRYLKKPHTLRDYLKRVHYNVAWLGAYGSLRGVLGNRDTVLE